MFSVTYEKKMLTSVEGISRLLSANVNSFVSLHQSFTSGPQVTIVFSYCCVGVQLHTCNVLRPGAIGTRHGGTPQRLRIWKWAWFCYKTIRNFWTYVLRVIRQITAILAPTEKNLLAGLLWLVQLRIYHINYSSPSKKPSLFSFYNM